MTHINSFTVFWSPHFHFSSGYKCVRCLMGPRQWRGDRVLTFSGTGLIIWSVPEWRDKTDLPVRIRTRGLWQEPPLGKGFKSWDEKKHSFSPLSESPILSPADSAPSQPLFHHSSRQANTRAWHLLTGRSDLAGQLRTGKTRNAGG